MSSSLGLARFREGLPQVIAFEFHNPEGVEYRTITSEMQPFQGCDSPRLQPRVARSSQPWARGFNPLGIEKPYDNNQASPLDIPASL